MTPTEPRSLPFDRCVLNTFAAPLPMSSYEGHESSMTTWDEKGGSSEGYLANVSIAGRQGRRRPRKPVRVTDPETVQQIFVQDEQRLQLNKDASRQIMHDVSVLRKELVERAKEVYLEIINQNLPLQETVEADGKYQEIVRRLDTYREDLAALQATSKDILNSLFTVREYGHDLPDDAKRHNRLLRNALGWTQHEAKNRPMAPLPPSLDASYELNSVQPTPWDALLQHEQQAKEYIDHYGGHY